MKYVVRLEFLKYDKCLGQFAHCNSTLTYLCHCGKDRQWVPSCHAVSDFSILSAVSISGCYVDQRSPRGLVFIHRYRVVHGIKYWVIVVYVANFNIYLRLKQKHVELRYCYHRWAIKSWS